MPRPPISAARGISYTPTRGALAGQTFTSERQYRNALARVRGHASLSQRQRAPKALRSLQDLAGLRPSELEARDRSLEAISLMRREGMSLAEAARAAHTTPNAVKRHASLALEKDASGRYRARARDPLLRPMQVLTTYGQRTLLIRDSRTASVIGAHWDAVGRYLETGDDTALRRLRRKSFRFEKVLYLLELDPVVIERLARAGDLRFESIYAAT